MKRYSAKKQEPLKVVHLCTYDFGGAGTAAYRLHKGLQSAGITSTMLVLEKKTKDPSIKVLVDSPSGKYVASSDICINKSPVLARQNLRWHKLLSSYPKRPTGLELFTDAVSDVRLDSIKEIQDADIINLHWVAGMLDYPGAPLTLGEKPIVWTLHDMNPFTGGCHYAGDCINYKTSCGACPQLASCDTDDLSQQIWNCKYDTYKSLRINIVTPSRWLAECASASTLFSTFHVDVIPNGLPADVFKPYSKAEIRKILNIPQDAKVVLFGAQSILNQRKGFEYLLAAMNNFSLKSENENVIFALFGDFPEAVEIKSKYQVCSLGTITDENNLAKIYSMADVFVISSLEDNLPNTVIEAMACGLPVVGFDVGGIPDMIEHKKTGYLVRPKDVRGLIEGISWIISSHNNGANFSRQCREKALKEFSLEGQAEAYIKLYKRTSQCCLPLTGDIDTKVKELSQQSNFEIEKNHKLTIATSIAQSGLDRQIKAIESWKELGFDVVSINCEEEIEILQSSFPDVKFVQAKRDARDLFGKPFIYFDDFLEYFKSVDTEICGIVNSDIFLAGDEGIIPFIRSHAKDSLVYGSRIDVDSLEVLDGNVYNDGFDFFFFHKSLMHCFPKSDFCIGQPWWDYWVPLIPVLEGIQVKKFVSPFAYHLMHPYKWHREHWDFLAERFFEHLRPKISEKLDSSPEHNPGCLLGKMLSIFHSQYLKENYREDKNKISPWLFTFCILEFLSKRTLQITYASSKVTCRKKQTDIFVHKTESQKQLPDYLHAEYEVSIVVCTKDRAELLDQMLTSLKDAAKGVTCEIIVVEGGSCDNTLDVLRKHRIAKVYSEHEWLGPGRHTWPQLYNFGFSKATGKWAMYASDDIIFSRGCISQAVELLNKQQDQVAGGIFFYKNVHPTNPEWNKYGIDFTHGSKLLMNYGLVRLDYFRQVGGLDDRYQFYCADSDLCYKLYQSGKQFIVMPASFVAHDNILDEQKMANMDVGSRDIELCQRRWIHFVPTELPSPRRLLWQEDFFDAFNLPADLGKIDSGIEYFWHGLACFQQGLFEQAKAKFRQAIDSGCNHWQVLWYLARSAYLCGDKVLAGKMAKAVVKSAPDFGQAEDFLRQLDDAEKTLMFADNHEDNLTVLIFSRDRAMQLQAAIESFFLHCGDSDKAKLYVLYSHSNQMHRRQYNRLKEKFDNISFVEQTNFKEQVLAVIDNCEHVLFMVDDNLFVRDFYLSDIVRSLRSNSDAAAFSLRLGKNTNYCYPRDANQGLPQFQQLDSGILKYDWTQAEFDFGYPLEVSSSVYGAADIRQLLAQLEFDNPNVLEGLMAANARLYTKSKANLLCYERSVTFCNPINTVQSVWANRAGTNHRYSADNLAQLFEQGTKIDVERYSNFVPNACHQEVELSLKKADEIVTDRPKFSIVMSNYNKSDYIAQAIESVINQTFRDWELIIVDDCSTDNSREIIKRYLGDNRIRFICHDSNRGIPSSAKTGIANVRSEYFGILDSDDCLVPHAVETMYKYHIKFPDCGLIYSQFTVCSDDLTPRCKGFCGPIPAGKTSLDADVASHFKTFKIRDYLKTSGYDENLPCAEDKDIIYKMEEVTQLKFVDECLYLYRQLPTAESHADGRVNIGIMCRVKARINALKRRCTALAGSENQSFKNLFRHTVNEARANYEDVEQYFVILSKLYEDGLLENLNLPEDVSSLEVEDIVLWLAANVNIDFERLFELLKEPRVAGSQPLVSVEMATYNAERFIKKAIESVLAQTYQNFELLIVDDGSTDGTKERVASYSDSRIRYIYQPHRNCASARNRAITEAKGEYIICVDSDDFIGPDYIEKMVACAVKHPGVDYFYPAKFTLVDESGNPTGQLWEYLDFSDNRNLPAFLFDKGYGPVPNPGSLIRKSLFERVGLYEELDTVEDFVFLCRNALKINFKRVEEHSTYFYRWLPTGSSHNFKARNQLMAKALNDMVSLYPPHILCSQIADIEDPTLRKQQYYEYLMTTFYRHSKGWMVRYGEYFKQYGNLYRTKLLTVLGTAESENAAVSNNGLSDLKASG